MEIVKKQIAHNYSIRTRAIKYIVIHDTGNTSIGANASTHYNYFNGDNRDSSADIFVDDHSAWYINNYREFYTWHCGDGGGIYGITNGNSVGVEICVNIDGDYETATQNTVKVVRELMKELNIPIERVVRHYDASRKLCPESMSGNNWDRWRTFVLMLQESEELTMNQYDELKQMIQNLRVQVYKTANPMIYNYIDNNMPEWARDSVRWAVNNDIIKGDGNGLALTDEKLWMIVVMKRIADSIGK